MLGVYRWEPPHAPATVTEFEQWLGRSMDFATAFNGIDEGRWDYVNGNAMDWQLGPWSNWLKAKPGRNMAYSIGFMPHQLGVTLADVAAGKHDANYVALANNLARYGMLNVYLRMGYEMDGGWFPWGAPKGSGKEASFAAAFRRVVTVMRQAQPGNKWKIMWNPTCDNWPVSGAAAYFESLWPGDEFVDIVGIDCYDGSFVDGKAYYPSGSNRLQRQQEVWTALAARLNLLRDFAFKHGKTLGFPEWALRTWPAGHDYVPMGGGDNPYFIEQMHKFFMDSANKVVMHSYFDNVNGWEGDARIYNGGHPNASARFKQLFGAGSQ